MLIHGSALLDKADLLADERNLFILSPVILYLFLFEIVAAFSVDGNDQRAELLDTAIPERLGHTEITPLGSFDLLYTHGGDDCVAGRNKS